MRKITAIWLCAMLMTGSMLMMMDVSENAEGKEIVRDGVMYTTHDPIRIDSNADFDEAHGVANWDTGDGSAGNPWIIENYDIDGTGYGYCIYIGNTTEHFVVRDCYLHEANFDVNWPYYGGQGLTLYNATNGLVDNNTVTDNYRGIYLYNNSHNNTILANTVVNSSHTGVHISTNSHFCIIANNNISYTGNWGLITYMSNNTQLIGNKVENGTSDGIYESFSINNHYSDNIVINNDGYGFNLIDSQMAKIEGGIIKNQDTGVFFSGTSNSEINGTTIYANDTGISSSNSDFNTFRNLELTAENTGISLKSSEQNNISSSSIIGTNASIYLYSSFTNEIFECDINNSDFGIILEKSENNTIKSCLITNMTVSSAGGISNNTFEKDLEVYQNDANWTNYSSFEEQLATGDGGKPLFTRSVDILDVSYFSVSIEGNMTDVIDLDLGIFLDGKDGNPIDGQTQTGEFVVLDADGDADESISLFYPVNGTYLIRVFGFDVIGDPGHFNMSISIFNTESTGILLIDSNKNKITQNTIENNSCGVNVIFNSDQNRFWHNNFIDNTDQAYDDTGTNSWHNGYPSGGNYWFDYAGTDAMSGPAQDIPGSDGIGDTPYNSTTGQGIQGGMGAQDDYPLMEPFNGTEPEPSDTSPPESSVDAITPYWRTTSPLALTATATDDYSGVAYVEFWYRFRPDNSSAWGPDWTMYYNDTTSGDGWSASFDFPEGQGYYEFYSIANDTANNTEAAPGAADARCAYDITPPQITDNSPAAGTTGDSYTFRAVVTDNMNLSAVHVIYWFGTGSETNATTTHTTADNWELGISIPLNSLDTLHYRIAAADRAGNWNSTLTRNVAITDNDDPVANAGANQTVDGGTLVTFDGSGSTDNIGITNHTWTFTHNGSAVTLHDVTPAFRFWAAGNYTVTLNVTDAAGNWDTDTMTVRALPLDSDGDGVPDNSDAFPTDPAASVDSDGDGYPDAWNPGMSAEDSTTGLVLDEFPDDPDKWEEPKQGGIGSYWWIILILILVLAVGALLGRKMMGKKPVEAGPEEAETAPEPESAISEEPSPAVEDAPPPQPDERIAKLEQAFKDGKITKEMYERNLKKFTEGK